MAPLNPRVATLVPKTNLNFTANHISRDVVAVTINTENTAAFINVYASPLEVFEPMLSLLQDLIEELNGNELIIVGYFNARSPM